MRSVPTISPKLLAPMMGGLRWIDDLGTRNRYVLDVWAGG